MAEISVQILERRWLERLPECETFVRAAVEAALQQLETADPKLEISLALADDEAIRILNRDFRQKDQPTNVLAFPAPPNPVPDAPPLAGDIIVALETLEAEARAQDKALSAHLQHLIVHGLLHLFDFDHDTDENASRMEQVEIQALQQLGVGNPYNDEVPAMMEMSRG